MPESLKAKPARGQMHKNSIKGTLGTHYSDKDSLKTKENRIWSRSVPHSAAQNYDGLEAPVPHKASVPPGATTR